MNVICRNKCLLYLILSFVFYGNLSAQEIELSNDSIFSEFEESDIHINQLAEKENIDSISTSFHSELSFTKDVEKTTPWNIYDQPYSLWENNPDKKKLIRNTLSVFGFSFVAAGILYAMPESVSNWDKESMSVSSVFSDWKRNVTRGPVVDKDDWFLNYVTHPYSGALYYMGARSAGCNAAYSFVYSVLLSTFFWEYSIESVAEVPSVQDLIVTPIFGSLLGEVFYLAKREIVKNNYYLLNSRIIGITAAILMDPLNEIIDLCVGKHRIQNKNKALSIYSYPTLNPNGKLNYQVGINLTF